jgi:hypothetical protein
MGNTSYSNDSIYRCLTITRSASAVRRCSPCNVCITLMLLYNFFSFHFFLCPIYWPAGEPHGSLVVCSSNNSTFYSAAVVLSYFPSITCYGVSRSRICNVRYIFLNSEIMCFRLRHFATLNLNVRTLDVGPWSLKLWSFEALQWRSLLVL